MQYSNSRIRGGGSASDQICSLISAASLLKGWENRGSFGEDVSCRVLRALEISGHSRGLDIVSFH